MIPTSSPWRLTTGLPELPPMMSAVQTKLNGVSRFSRPCARASFAAGRTAPGCRAPRRGGRRRRSWSRAALHAQVGVALAPAEGQPQGEGGVGIDVGALTARTGPWRSWRRPAAAARRPCSLDSSCGPGGRARRPAGPARIMGSSLGLDRLHCRPRPAACALPRRPAGVPRTSSAARCGGDLPSSTLLRPARCRPRRSP